MYCDFSYEGFEGQGPPRTNDTTSRLREVKRNVYFYVCIVHVLSSLTCLAEERTDRTTPSEGVEGDTRGKLTVTCSSH